MTPDPEIPTVATYERTVRASAERVWENVLDWEHLPWLHADAFQTIQCEGAGRWGWRARVSLARPPHPEIAIELLVDREASRYVTRTTEGAGAGTEIWTEVTPQGDAETGIRVAFLVPGIAPEHRDGVGQGYVSLYTTLWDEDEDMMRERQRALDDGALARPPSGRDPVALGPVEALRLPHEVIAHGRRYRVVRAGEGLHAHPTACPHLGGPLAQTDLRDGAVTCPWHGYTFDLETGRERGGRPCRMIDRPAVVVEAGEARLEFDT